MNNIEMLGCGFKTKYIFLFRGSKTSHMLSSLLEENLRIQYSLFQTQNKKHRVKTDLHLPSRMKVYI